MDDSQLLGQAADKQVIPPFAGKGTFVAHQPAHLPRLFSIGSKRPPNRALLQV